MGRPTRRPPCRGRCIWPAGPGELKLVGVHAPPAVLMDGQTSQSVASFGRRDRPGKKAYFSEPESGSATPGGCRHGRLIDGGRHFVVSGLRGHRFEAGLGGHALAPPRGGRPFSSAKPPSNSCGNRRARSSWFRRPHAAPEVQHVLVPLDGSPLAETMIGPAVRFAKAVGADLSFVFAGTRNRAKELEPLARANGAQVLVVEGDAATAIVAAAEARPGSVVALATHARGGLVKLFRGSVADDVVHLTKTPVLIRKAEETAAA